MTTEELKVVLRRSEHSGFGFSLLGTSGPPHVIYDIVENSPAADCGAVSLHLTHTLTNTIYASKHSNRTAFFYCFLSLNRVFGSLEDSVGFWFGIRNSLKNATLKGKKRRQGRMLLIRDATRKRM